MNNYKLNRNDNEGIRENTINTELRSIKMAFSCAYKYDIIDSFPFKGNGFLFNANAHKRAFTQQENPQFYDHTTTLNFRGTVNLV